MYKYIKKSKYIYIYNYEYIYIYIDLLFRRLIISHQTGPSSFSFQHFSLNNCVFDAFLRFCLPICGHFLAQVAPRWPPTRNFIDFWSILGALGTTWRHHWRPRGRLGRHFSLISIIFGWTLVQFLCEFRKNRTFCYFNAPLQRNHYC